MVTDCNVKTGRGPRGPAPRSQSSIRGFSKPTAPAVGLGFGGGARTTSLTKFHFRSRRTPSDSSGYPKVLPIKGQDPNVKEKRNSQPPSGPQTISSTRGWGERGGRRRGREGKKVGTQALKEGAWVAASAQPPLHHGTGREGNFLAAVLAQGSAAQP